MPPDLTTLSSASGGGRESLIERLMAATGWDSGLDAEVAVASGWGEQDAEGGWHAIGVFFPDGKTRRTAYTVELPPFTGSIDAALTLVPDGWAWGVEAGDGRRPWAWLAAPSKPMCGEGKHGATPALAIVIASLRARAA